jgi:hypothetical protein
MYAETNAHVPKGMTIADIHELVNGGRSSCTHQSISSTSEQVAELINKTMEGTFYKEPNRGMIYFTTWNYKN